MLDFTADQVRMRQQAATKDQALVLMAQVMAQDGLTDDGYLAGMRAREKQGATYLGQGVAIPHGTPDSRVSVRQTGVRILHFPDGVDWGEGQQVFLAVGIAAQSDEHLGILQMLTRALGQDNLESALRRAQSADAVLHLLRAGEQTLALDDSLVALGAEAGDLEELAWFAAQRLKRAGCVGPGFASTLLGDPPLPLGEGLWWLHSGRGVTRPGMAFVTPRQPLSLDGAPLKGLLCLASAGRAHVAAVARLCDLLAGGESEVLLAQQDPKLVAQALGAVQAPDWPDAAVRLPNALGLHARPANQLAQVAKTVAGEVWVRVAGGGAPVSAKSLSRLLSLGVRRGQTLVFSVEPESADEALPRLVEAVMSGLGESVEPLPTPDESSVPAMDGHLASAVLAADHAHAAVQVATTHAAPRAGEPHRAVPASSGIASGPAYVQVAPSFDYAAQGVSPAHETARLAEALAAVSVDLDAWMADSTTASIREIFAAHRAMLDDPDLTDSARRVMATGASAEAAWERVIQEAAAAQESLQDALLAERAADLRDVGRRVLGRLCGVVPPEAPDTPYVLIMEDIGPSDVARLDAGRVAGILTARGGATSHSAIVARALGIPALVGAGESVLHIAAGVCVLVDGETGVYHIDPAPDALAQALAAREMLLRRQAEAHAQRHAPAVTQDGHGIEVAANLGDAAAGAAAVDAGAEAVGLLRTEFLFMAQDRAPGYDEQLAAYRRVFDDLNGRPLVVRTLDVGGDKPLAYWPMPHEDNPFLGVRGIRLSLQRPDVLRTQLDALLAASRGAPLRIMFPMVGDVAQWRQVRLMVADAVEAFRQAGGGDLDLQVGIMVEVPSAALLAEHFAREADFFSIGTNDLTQYALAIDRGHPELSAQADGLHPAVLRLIDLTVRAAHAHDAWVGVCGELAADSHAVPVLIGLGVDELSMSASGIARIKADIRELSYASCVALAGRALDCATAAEVRSLQREEV